MGSVMRKWPAIIALVLFNLTLPVCVNAASEDTAHKLAVQNADARIDAYQQAVTSGDPAMIKETALAVQADPLAVQRVNKNMPPEFKQQISNHVVEVRETAKANIKKQAAEHYGVHENRITFMEATNPSTDPKLGQDWDVTVQVDGMAVPLDVAAPMVQQSFYEAAKGHKAATPQEAAHFAHEQAVEPINQSSAEAYGSGGKIEVTDPATGKTKIVTEGADIIAGDKSKPMRDAEHFGHVMEHKSDLAKQRADQKIAEAEAKIQKEGLSGAEAETVRNQAKAEAVGWEMEQGRQYDKQEAAQIKKRVEAKGGEIPQHVQKGNEILDKVASGDISPEEGRKQLADMGETPESVIKKGTSLVEAAEKLGTTPAEKIARANAGEAPKDVFVENVKEKMALKKLERDAAAMKEGPRANLLDGEGKSSSAHLEETLPDTRAEQVRDRTARTAAEQGLDAPKSLLEGGKSSSAHTDVQGTVDGVMDTVDWTGWAVDAYHKEEQAAAEQGRNLNWLNVGKEAWNGLAAGNAFSTFKKHGEAAKTRAESTGESKWLAGLAAWGLASAEFVHNALTGIKKQHEGYQKEEIEKEIARAQQAGEAANQWRAKIPALMRIMGDVMQVNRLADWWADDSAEAVRAAAEMKKKVEVRAKAGIEVELASFGKLERDLRAALEKSEGSASEEVLTLQKEYHDRMTALQDLRNDLFAKGYIDPKNAEWTAINQSVNLLDSNVVETLKTEMQSVFEDQKHVQILREGIQNCKMTPVESRLEQIQNPETKAMIAAEMQAHRDRVAAFNQKLQQVNALETAGNLTEARAALAPLIDQVPCESGKGVFVTRLQKLNQRIEIQEKVAAADCSFLKGSSAFWVEDAQRPACRCPSGTEIDMKAGECAKTIAAQLAAADCSHVPGSEPFYNNSTGKVVCACPDRWLYDAELQMCVVDRERMNRELDEIKNERTSYDTPEPYYDDYAAQDDYNNQQATENALIQMLQNTNQRVYGSGSGNSGVNLDQMYGNMAAGGGTQWSDPTNTASGSAYRPAGYTTHKSTPAATAVRSIPTGGPGVGEFPVNQPASYAAPQKDWCTTGRDAAGCKGVQL